MSEMKIDEYGSQVWLNKAEQCHREDGPAYIYPNGYQAWYINGKLHRLDGPAVIAANGYQTWYIDGLRHRLDGPAVIQPDGAQGWWITDIEITDHATSWIKENDFPDYTLWTDGQRIMFLFAFSGIKS